jgi:MFS family permease
MERRLILPQAFYTASLASGSVVGGITGGYIAAELGWVMLFWIGAGLTGLACLLTIFLVPETMFDRGKHTLPIQRTLPRPSRYIPHPPPLPPTATPAVRAPTSVPKLSLMTLPSMRFTLPSRLNWPGTRASAAADPDLGLTWYKTSSTTNLPDLPADQQQQQQLPQPHSQSQRASLATNTPNRTTPQHQQLPPYTYARALRFSPYRGHILHHLAKPWTTLSLPATWIIMMQYGGLVGGVAVISTVGPQILARPPYNWGEHAGLLFVGALVGIVLGGLCTGLMADWRTKKLARGQDHGYAEPEARLAVMVPALVVGTGGLLVFGLCARYSGRWQWIGLEFAYGMVAFALAQVPSVWFSYVSVLS